MGADNGKKSKVAERGEDEESDDIDGELVLSIEKLQEIQDELEKYYVTPRAGGKKKKGAKMVTVKKRLKLIKGLSRDLSMFYGMGFGMETEDGLIGEVKGKMISTKSIEISTDGGNKILLAQLQQLRAEEKDLNKKKDCSFVLPANPLCIGVGMEDVSTIVANLFGEERKDLGLMAAA
ncbi:hypothetical protein HHK36_005512 [Tetracentron sinense]|uniref:Uncharacterized protein n=1 Tax=Tetracentron sinense TaxID=13715 RepID=A0A834ZLK0_TETSI|nr:hypothetical protein HHK36_005512 [Tetracentron sinense]